MTQTIINFDFVRSAILYRYSRCCSIRFVASSITVIPLSSNSSESLWQALKRRLLSLAVYLGEVNNSFRKASLSTITLGICSARFRLKYYFPTPGSPHIRMNAGFATGSGLSFNTLLSFLTSASTSLPFISTLFLIWDSN